MNQMKTIAHTIAITHTLNSAQNNFKFVITNLVSIKFMYSSFNTLLQVSYPVFLLQVSYPVFLFILLGETVSIKYDGHD